MGIDIKELEFLEDKLNPDRRALFRKILEQRTDHFTVAIEDVYQLHNTSAVIRSCDVFGVQNVHVIEEINFKRIDREIAMGAQKWIDVNRYDSTKNCITSLREQGYRIIATTPHRGTALQDFDISHKAAVFFGTETNGISGELEKNADEFLQIPMVGFTQSLNISVSAAIILQELTFRLRRSDVNWKFSDTRKLEKRMDWTLKNLKKADQYLKSFHTRD